MSDVRPSHTLYLRNLDEKANPNELKKLLHAAFSCFGQIVEIRANRKILRGQAFIIFKEIESAVDAMKVLQGQPFLDKPLRIEFARQESKVIAMAKGDYKWESSRRKKPSTDSSSSSSSDDEKEEGETGGDRQAGGRDEPMEEEEEED